MKWMKIVYTFTGVDILFKSRLPACALMAEDGFYFPDFLGNFFGECWAKLPASPLQLGTNLAPKPGVGVALILPTCCSGFSMEKPKDAASE
jgi:hypothetical protein